MNIVRILLSPVLLLLATVPASAHFVWVAAGPQTPDGKVHVYFSESASPDDPALLDKITDLQLWRIGADGKAALLKTVKDADSLVAEGAADDGAMFVASHDYGVISRGNETFLLKYHAKFQPSAKPQTWRALADASRLPMEIVARATEGDQTRLTVIWQGKPLAGSTVTVTGPGIESKLEGTSDAKGDVSFSLKSTGVYSIRAKHTEAIEGKQQDKAYSSIRHYATLTLNMGDVAASTTTGISLSPAILPSLDPGITSFGAAIVDDSLYLYGGHFGKPHHYSKEGQSDRLLRLDLKHPAKWDVVSTGPKRTGLTSVAHGGKFYRIGGFEARNEDAEKQSLWSMPDFARFDPKSGRWQQLPDMPAGRSSHDALVIGNTLYVVGGWELKGEGNSQWHDSAYSVDLAASTLEWKQLPKPPFQRRALSLGEWQGKVYVIGGMQPEGGPTTATAIFDPKSQTWSEGPKLNGEPMEGFGSSAFLCGGKLYVSTFAGNLQTLSDDGGQWTTVGKLTHPRFFHRMLPLNSDQLLIVGGASMKAGKIGELETMKIASTPSGD